MKLISGIHDYYDGVIRTTKQDQSILFFRQPRDIIVRHVNGRVFGQGQRDHLNDYYFYFNIIGFCGMLFPFIGVEEMSKNNWTSKITYYYDVDSILSDFKGIKNTKTAEGRYRRDLGGLKKQIEHWLNKGEETGWGSNLYNVYNDEYLKELFIKEGIAYFVIKASRGTYKGNTIKVYPILKDLMFFKKFDAFTTYQMIEMFLSNQLVKHNDKTVIISDVLKAQSKGFDKWSFRKCPNEKGKHERRTKA